MAKRIPSLNWLRVFEAAARANSFARAAERLAMSPPAVSQQIRALEQHLGRELFDRGAARVQLTEAGRSLLAVVSDALGRMEEAAEVLSAPSKPPLVVGVSLSLFAGWLAPRLPEFEAEHPNIDLKIQSLLGRPERPSRDAALWIGFGQPPPETDSIKLFGESLFPVARPDIASQICTFEDCLNFRLIEVSDHRKNWAQIVGTDVLPRHARTIYVDTTFAALSLAGSGYGVAIARTPASDDLVERFGLVPCVEEAEFVGVEDYFLVSSANARLSPEALAFQDWIVQNAGTT